MRHKDKDVPRFLVAFFSAILCGATLLPTPLFANPEGGSVAQGSATITNTPGLTHIQQTSDKAVINWQGFSIGAGEETRFSQPNSGSIALNRVTAANNPSNIAGRLNANGQVWLINPAGIVFHQGSQVNVAGLVATTANIKDADFMAGNYRFKQAPGNTAGIINNGSITVHDRGLVALVAPGVENNGKIVARLGKVALASGTEFTVDLHGDQLIQFAAGSETTQSPTDPNTGQRMKHAVSNSGQIYADGGQVLMSAQTAEGIVDNAVNMDGIIEAKTIGTQAGRVVLAGGSTGTTRVSGTIDVQGLMAGEHGGTIHITGKKVGVLAGAKIKASGKAGGGTVLIGGSGNAATAQPRLLASERNLQQAELTYVDPTAVIEANATDVGNGGNIVVWSDINNPNGSTRAYGSFSAQGGPNGGDGGFIETSGHYLDINNIKSVNTLAAMGKTGTWLLDPVDIYIVAPFCGSGTVGCTAYTTGQFQTGNSFTSSGLWDNFSGSSSLPSALINSTLTGQLASTSVTVDATQGTGGTGTIRITAPISASTPAGNSLTFIAAPGQNIILEGDENGNNASINIGGSVIFSSPVTLTAGGGIAGSAQLTVAPTITSTLGNVTFSSTLQGNTGLAPSINALTLSAPAGSVTFTGAVGNTTPLNSLTVSASNTIAINANMTIDGTAAFSDANTLNLGGTLNLVTNTATPLTLADINTFNLNAPINVNGSLAATSKFTNDIIPNVSVTAPGSINQAFALATTSTGTVTINGGTYTDTAIEPIQAFNVILNGAITVDNNFDLGESITLGSDTTITSTNGYIAFDGTITGSYSLDLYTSSSNGDIFLEGPISELSSFSATPDSSSNISLGQIFSMQTSGDINFAGDIALLNNSGPTYTITSTNGDITFQNAIDGYSGGNQTYNALTISAPNGTVIFNGAVGENTLLNSLIVEDTSNVVVADTSNINTGTGGLFFTVNSTNGTITINGDASSEGTVAMYADAITLANSTSITSGVNDNTSTLTLSGNTLTIGNSVDIVAHGTGSTTSLISTNNMSIGGGTDIEGTAGVTLNGNDGTITLGTPSTSAITLCGSDTCSATIEDASTLTLTSGSALNINASPSTLTLTNINTLNLGGYITGTINTTSIPNVNVTAASTNSTPLITQGSQLTTASTGILTVNNTVDHTTENVVIKRSLNFAVTSPSTALTVNNFNSTTNHATLNLTSNLIIAANDIDLDGITSSGNSLTLSGSNNITLDGNISGLTNLTTNIGGATKINTNLITTTGAQTYNNAVAIENPLTLNAGSGNITFGSTLNGNGASNLTLSGGAIIFTGTIGTSSGSPTIAGLTVQDASSITANDIYVGNNGLSLTASGTIQMNGAVSAEDSGTASGNNISLNAGNNINIAGTMVTTLIHSATSANITLTAGNTISISSDVTAGRSLTLTANTGTISVAPNVTLYAGNSVFNSNTTLNLTANNIVLNNNTTLRSDGSPATNTNGLQLNGAGSNSTLTFGNNVHLISNDPQNTIRFNNINTINVNGAVTLTAPTLVTTSVQFNNINTLNLNNVITTDTYAISGTANTVNVNVTSAAGTGLGVLNTGLNSAIALVSSNGNLNVGVNNTGNGFYNESLVVNKPLNSLSAVGGTVTLNSLTTNSPVGLAGSWQSNAGNLTFNGAVNLTGTTNLNSGNNAITFNSNINGGNALTLTAGNLIHLNGDIGNTTRIGNFIANTPAIAGNIAIKAASILMNSLQANNVFLSGTNGVFASVIVDALTLDGQNGGTVNGVIGGYSDFRSSVITQLASSAAGLFVVNGCLLPGGCVAPITTLQPQQITEQATPEETLVCTSSSSGKGKGGGSSKCNSLIEVRDGGIAL